MRRRGCARAFAAWRLPCAHSKPAATDVTVVICAAAAGGLTDAEIARWRDVPVAIAVDLSHESQIDPAIRPINPPGKQPRLFGRAVTVSCTPPDFGAVVHALEHVGKGEVLMIAAGGDSVTAMIGEILSG